MKRYMLCFMVICGMTLTGCGIVEGVLKTVAISKKVNDVRESETPIEALKALKDLLEEVN